jgi:NitT/TauT family transport system substrate-binding protein
MFRSVSRFAQTACTLAVLAVASTASPAMAADKEFKVCWSIYAGWMPWGYLQDSGIMKKWADKYGVKIDIVQINDYVECINQYTAGAFVGATSTTMDAISIPAAGGVDTTVLIAGDYSNGNDGVILKGKDKLEDIKGQKVNLVEFSVSHYFLARALESVGMTERDVTIVNTADPDMIAAYPTEGVTAMVTWNPMLATIDAMDGANLVYDSTKIPGEIVDAMIVNTEVLKANPELGKALTGAWLEVLALMQSDTPEGKAALEAMAKASGATLAEYEMQVSKTKLFFTAPDLLAFTTDAKMKEAHDFVRKFLFEKGLLGQGATSPDAIGIEFSDKSVLGDANNIKLRFNADFVKMAVDGKL